VKERFFCTFCELPQKVYKRKHIHLFELLGLAVAGAITSYLIWQEFHWASLFLFISLVTITELTYQVRWRHSVKCKGCGFDPISYKKDPEQAALDVKNYLEMRKQDPSYLLRPQPRIKPIIKKVKNYKWTDLDR
jgi:hypothetical protein